MLAPRQPLRVAPPLRLVVLNACDTGQGSAATLIRRGIPAVVAMQFEITDTAAVRFAQTFYQHVAKRRPVDESVMRARRALRLAKKDTLEWGTPVLYLRAPDGRIFDTIVSPPPRSASSPDPVPAPELAATPRTPARQEPPDPPAPPPAVPHLRLVHTLRHRKEATAVAFSPDGHRLATASTDKTARIWDAASEQELARVSHDGPVEGVAFSSDGRRLATASDDMTARIWALSDDE